MTIFCHLFFSLLLLRLFPLEVLDLDLRACSVSPTSRAVLPIRRRYYHIHLLKIVAVEIIPKAPWSYVLFSYLLSVTCQPDIASVTN